jgi:hypothetical protein
MGQGRKDTPEPAKAPPAGGDAGFEEGDEPAATEFCLMEHSVAIRLLPNSGAVLGMKVHLGLASPPTVLAASGKIGHVSDSLGRALSRCLMDGFVLSGEVDFVDLEARSGQITVSGRSD